MLWKPWLQGDNEQTALPVCPSISPLVAIYSVQTAQDLSNHPVTTKLKEPSNSEELFLLVFKSHKVQF
jgi:hypothetical protein